MRCAAVQVDYVAKCRVAPGIDMDLTKCHCNGIWKSYFHLNCNMLTPLSFVVKSYNTDCVKELLLFLKCVTQSNKSQTNRASPFTIHWPNITHFAWEVQWLSTASTGPHLKIRNVSWIRLQRFKSLWQLSSHESTKVLWTIWICLWFNASNHGSCNSISRNYIGRFQDLRSDQQNVADLKFLSFEPEFRRPRVLVKFDALVSQSWKWDGGL